MRSSIARHPLRPLLIVATLIAGCAKRSVLPTYPARLDEASLLRVLAERADAVKTISAQGTIRFTKPDGESVRLDVALASQPPEWIRLRAWKFSQAVFDLTITPDGAWLVAPRDDGKRRGDILAAGRRSEEFAKAWSLFTMFDDADLQAEVRGSELIVRRSRPDEPMIVCRVARHTLTPRRYELMDDDGEVRFSLDLSRYEMFKGIPWPQRAIATSPAGEVLLELREIELNGELPPQAFTPPPRAERLP